MNTDAFTHLAHRLQFPNGLKNSQAEYDAQRLAAVERSLLFRPQFLPFKHTLPAAAQEAPISVVTDRLKYSSILTGAITDGEDRDVRLYRNRSTNSLINYGKEAGLRLSLDSIAGHSVATAGFAGVRKFPVPYTLDEQEYLTMDMYQDTSPGSTEDVWTVFTGVRSFTPAHADAQLSAKDRKAVMDSIAARPAPETKFAICKVTFDANGNASAETPENDEPMMIVGHRTTFTDALVSFGFTTNFGFSEQPFPIWALANEANNDRDVWNMLDVPLFLGQWDQAKYDLSNVVGSLTATDGNIEVLLQTM